jgi:hypothetical protein
MIPSQSETSCFDVRKVLDALTGAPSLSVWRVCFSNLSGIYKE